jgi:hypothetical protein
VIFIVPCRASSWPKNSETELSSDKNHLRDLFRLFARDDIPDMIQSGLATKRRKKAQEGTKKDFKSGHGNSIDLTAVFIVPSCASLWLKILNCLHEA